MQCLQLSLSNFILHVDNNQSSVQPTNNFHQPPETLKEHGDPKVLNWDGLKLSWFFFLDLVCLKAVAWQVVPFARACNSARKVSPNTLSSHLVTYSICSAIFPWMLRDSHPSDPDLSPNQMADKQEQPQGPTACSLKTSTAQHDMDCDGHVEVGTFLLFPLGHVESLLQMESLGHMGTPHEHT